MTVVLIARCPEHGFLWLDDNLCRFCPRNSQDQYCGKPLESVPMVPVAEVVEALRKGWELERYLPPGKGAADFIEREFGAEGER